MLSTETIGPYDVKKLSDGKYSVVLNNGNIGAYVTTENHVKELREKYSHRHSIFDQRRPQIIIIPYPVEPKKKPAPAGVLVLRTLASILFGSVLGGVLVKYCGKIPALKDILPKIKNIVKR